VSDTGKHMAALLLACHREGGEDALTSLRETFDEQATDSHSFTKSDVLEWLDMAIRTVREGGIR
jgi:hypothetical protein